MFLPIFLPRFSRELSGSFPSRITPGIYPHFPPEISIKLSPGFPSEVFLPGFLEGSLAISLPRFRSLFLSKFFLIVHTGISLGDGFLTELTGTFFEILPIFAFLTDISSGILSVISTRFILELLKKYIHKFFCEFVN